MDDGLMIKIINSLNLNGMKSLPVLIIILFSVQGALEAQYSRYYGFPQSDRSRKVVHYEEYYHPSYVQDHYYKDNYYQPYSDRRYTVNFSAGYYNNYYPNNNCSPNNNINYTYVNPGYYSNPYYPQYSRYYQTSIRCKRPCRCCRPYRHGYKY